MSKKHKNESYVPDEPKEPEIPQKPDESPYLEPNEPEVFPEEAPVIIVPERFDPAPREIE